MGLIESSPRWPNGVRCLACNYDKCYQIATKEKTGKPCRLFECAECGLHFSSLWGTLFHDSHLPLNKWFMAMASGMRSEEGNLPHFKFSVTSDAPTKRLGTRCNSNRKAMDEVNAAPLGGIGKVIEIDETFLGGKKTGKGVKAAVRSKIRVLGIAERNGRVHLQRIKDGKAGTLRTVFEKTIDPKTDMVVADGATNIAAIINPARLEQHKHQDDFEREGKLAAQTVEGAFSLFKAWRDWQLSPLVRRPR